MTDEMQVVLFQLFATLSLFLYLAILTTRVRLHRAAVIIILIALLFVDVDMRLSAGNEEIPPGNTRGNCKRCLFGKLLVDL